MKQGILASKNHNLNSYYCVITAGRAVNLFEDDNARQVWNEQQQNQL